VTVWVVIAKIMIVAVFGAAAVLLGGRVVTLVFKLAERTRATELPENAEHPEAIAPLTYAATFLRGGEWIGYLERLAVYGAILAGFPEGVAVAMVVSGSVIRISRWCGSQPMPEESAP